jgi:hypothetical protein
VLPAGFGVVKAELGHDLAGSIDDDGVMMLLGPIEAGEVSERGLRGHNAFPVQGSGGVLCSSCLCFGPWST